MERKKKKYSPDRAQAASSPPHMHTHTKAIWALYMQYLSVIIYFRILSLFLQYMLFFLHFFFVDFYVPSIEDSVFDALYMYRVAPLYALFWLLHRLEKQHGPHFSLMICPCHRFLCIALKVIET